jgi:hypothetical protein
MSRRLTPIVNGIGARHLRQRLCNAFRELAAGLRWRIEPVPKVSGISSNRAGFQPKTEAMIAIRGNA